MSKRTRVKPFYKNFVKTAEKSLGLDVARADHLSPFFCLVSDELASNPTLPRQHFSLREGEHLDRAFDAHLAGEHSGRSVARRRARQLPPAADIPPYEAMSEKCQDRSLPQCSTLAGEQYCRHIEAKPTLR